MTANVYLVCSLVPPWSGIRPLDMGGAFYSYICSSRSPARENPNYCNHFYCCVCKWKKIFRWHSFSKQSQSSPPYPDHPPTPTQVGAYTTHPHTPPGLKKKPAPPSRGTLPPPQLKQKKAMYNCFISTAFPPPQRCALFAVRALTTRSNGRGFPYSGRRVVPSCGRLLTGGDFTGQPGGSCPMRSSVRIQMRQIAGEHISVQTPLVCSRFLFSQIGYIFLHFW